VTALTTEAVTSASGLTSPMQLGSAVGFSQITSKLMSETGNKAPQLSGHEMPRLLVIATEHEGADLLMGSHAAEEMLTGSTLFRVRVGDVEAKPEIVASLKNSVFFRETKNGGKVEPARQSISAILLMHIRSEGAYVIGVLHPVPVVKFDPAISDRIHFVRLRQWPIESRFGIEWIGPAPSATQYPHIPKGLTGADVVA
jgi:hypothetical protein